MLLRTMWARSTETGSCGKAAREMGPPLVRNGRGADAPAAVDHPRRLIQRVRGTGTFEDILHALAAGDPLNRYHGIFIVHVDDGIGAELFAHFQPAFSSAG